MQRKSGKSALEVRRKSQKPLTPTWNDYAASFLVRKSLTQGKSHFKERWGTLVDRRGENVTVQLADGDLNAQGLWRGLERTHGSHQVLR